MKSKANKSILFVCHESSRTGAPVFLFDFIKWIKSNTSVTPYILIDKQGPLTGEFEKLGPVVILRPEKPSLFNKLWQKIAFRSYMELKLKPVAGLNIDLIYLNTVANGLLSSILRNKFEARIITHIHELESVIRAKGKHNMELIRKNTFHYIAASHAVKRNLMLNHRIPDNRITVHYESIDITRINDLSLSKSDHELLLDENDFIVGGAGFVGFRKGFDLFIQTAWEVCGNRGFSRIKFLWIGAFGRGKEKMVREMIEQGNLGGNVFFLGEKENPISYYRVFDLFFLTSREDPFPIVMLENAYLGNPVIGFKDRGGFEEFAEGNTDLLVDHYDAGRAADKIIEWSKAKDKISQTGENLKQRVIEKYTIQRNGQSYLQNIQNLKQNL